MLNDGVKPLERAIDALGSLSEFARQLKVSPQVVANWRRRGIPAERVLEIERVTIDPDSGAPRVTRSDLRPDLYPRSSLAQWIDELIGEGLSEAQIAARCGATPQTLSGVRTGAIQEPGHELTKALAKLHVERCTGRAA